MRSIRFSPLGLDRRGSVGIARSVEGYRRNSRETLELRISANRRGRVGIVVRRGPGRGERSGLIRTARFVGGTTLTHFPLRLIVCDCD